MAGKERTDTSTITTTVTVHVEPDAAPRLAVGSRWRVVSSSQESLWQGRYSVTLERTEEASK